MKRPPDATLPHVRALAGAVLMDPAQTLTAIERAGGLPPGAADGDPDAASIFRACAMLTNAGTPITSEGLVQAAGLTPEAQTRLLRSGESVLSHEVGGFVRAIREAGALRRAGQELTRTDADLAYKLGAVQELLTPLIGGDGAATDAAAWLSEPDELEQPIVTGLFDHGDRVSIVGQSKARKSFFAMQLAVAIAAGRPFLGVETVRQSVLLVNGEIRPGPYRKRLRRMLAALGIESKELSGRLAVWNSVDHAEPVTWGDVFTASKKAGVGVVVVDPAYLLMGDEVDQIQAKSNVQAMKRFARSGITLVSVFHATKGMIGDRQVIDRVAGSGIYARDASTMIALCEHATEPDHVVLSAVTRNHPPQEPKSIAFCDGAFFVADVAAVEKTSKTRAARKYDPQTIADCLPTGDGLKYGQAADRIRERMAVGLNKAKELLGAAVESGHVEMLSLGTRTEYRKHQSV